jgi:hypothetical protein
LTFSNPEAKALIRRDLSDAANVGRPSQKETVALALALDEALDSAGGVMYVALVMPVVDHREQASKPPTNR